MPRTKAEEKLYRALAAATRSGLHSASSTERGVLVEIDGREIPVGPDLVEQIVADTAPSMSRAMSLPFDSCAWRNSVSMLQALGSCGGRWRLVSDQPGS